MLEHIFNLWWALLLLGFAGGIISGALGVGSGIIFVPVLVIVFLLPQKAAQGTALAVMAPMALFGALRYWRNPNIDVNLNLVALLAIGALAGVWLGAEIAHCTPGHWLRKAFALLMAAAAVRMFLMPPRPPDAAAGTLKAPQATATDTQRENDE